MATAVVVAAFLSATSARTVPGGPLISLHTHAFPALICGVVMVLAWRSWRASTRARRVGLILVVFCAVALVGLLAADVAWAIWDQTCLRTIEL